MQWGHVIICLKCICWCIPQSILLLLFLFSKRQYQNPVARLRCAWIQLGLPSWLSQPSVTGWSRCTWYHLVSSWLQWLLSKSLVLLAIWTTHYTLRFSSFISGVSGAFCLVVAGLRWGRAWLSPAQSIRGPHQSFFSISRAVILWVPGAQLCKNKSWCWFNPITLRWSLNHWTLSRIPALIL